tara:strand:+ start:2252 stop:4801 length:2550 start_codon:yes stop_codon:yes gene_type:complete
MRLLGKSNNSYLDLKPAALAGEESGLLENIGSAYDAITATENRTSQAKMIQEVQQPMIDTMQEMMGMDDLTFRRYMFNPDGLEDPQGKRNYNGIDPNVPGKAADRQLILNERMHDYALTNPAFKQYLDDQGLPTGSDKWVFSDYITQLAVEKAEGYNDVYEESKRKQSTWGLIGQGVGNFGGFMADPADLLSIFIPYVGQAKVVSKIAQAATINIGIEALEYQDVREWHKRVTGEDYTPKQFLQNAGLIGAATAGIVGVIEGVTKIPFGKYLQSIENSINRKLMTAEQAEIYELMRKASADINGYNYVPDKDIANMQNHNSAKEILEVNNKIANDTSNTKHNKKMMRFLNAVINNDYSSVPKQQTANIKAVSSIYDLEDLNFSVEDLSTSGKTVQFFKYIDDEGVEQLREIDKITVAPGDVPDIVTLKRLEGQDKTYNESISMDKGTVVEKTIEGVYDPILAGHVLAFQKTDGTIIVKDGKKRIALAKKDGVKNVKSFILRESEGFTEETAEIVALVKNYYDGTLSKAGQRRLSRFPDMVALLDEFDPKVAKSKNFLRLGNRGTEAFARQIVSLDVAASVGKYVDDDFKQIAMMDLIIKKGITDETTIEKFIEDTVAAKILDDITPDQLSMSFKALNYVPERDRIIENAIYDLEKENIDLGVKISRLDQNPNTKVSDQNRELKKRKTDNEEIIELIEGYGNSNGEVADIFTRAAIEIEERGLTSAPDATANTIKRIREGSTDGTFDGIQGYRDGNNSNVTAQINASKAEFAKLEPQLAKFDSLQSSGTVEDVRKYRSDLQAKLDANPALANTIVEIDEKGAKTISEVLDELSENNQYIDFIKECQLTNG